VGVLELGRDLDLAEKALSAERGGEVFAQDLNRDLAVVLQVMGQVDGGHATAAELTLDAVAIGQRTAQSLEEIRHGTASMALSWPKM
jgi:hypothetical protein